jgi:hypothetical protein
MGRRLPLLATVFIASLALTAAEPAYQDPVITPAQRQHWAYLPPLQPPLPAVRNAAWVRTPIDAFILAKLEANGLAPSPEADRLTWLRRVSFDLTGLPPTSREQDDFVNDQSPNAHEKVVERLLASPHYGERWAQHWLDVVRYAESNGYEADAERPHAWRYRDYVVRSFNTDKPYDQFLREQIAGDFLVRPRPKSGGWFFPAPPVPPAAAEPLIATGMHRCGPMHFIGGNADPEVVRQEILTEMVNGLGSAVLGLTIGCARCHDHKFDPISQGDYYRLQAFFAATQLKDVDLATPAEKAAREKAAAAIQAKIAPLAAKVTALEAPHRAKLTEMKKAALEPRYREALTVPADKRTPKQKELAEHANILIKVTWDEVVAALSPEEKTKRRAWRDEIHALEAQLPPPAPQAWSVRDDEKAPPTYVLKRGETKNKSIVVESAFVRVLGQDHEDKPRGSLTRKDLADWLTRPEHPLTARVWVNRVWQHHFGRGLVATPNDFGARGQRPTHPELLDWLATELPRRGGSTKELHRLIVLSATYRQSSKQATQSADPENRLLWRMHRTRLEGETMRDAMLAAAGTLNRAIGGPRVLVPLEPEVYDLIFTEAEPDGLWLTTPDVRQHTRRSLYLFAKRNVRQPFLEAFDQPDTLNPCPVRPISTFAPQALILMNGPLAQAQSKAFAARLLAEAGREPAALIERAYRLALGRPPRDDEARIAGDFLRKQEALLRERGRGDAQAAALADFCLAMFNLNEFIYVE